MRFKLHYCYKNKSVLKAINETVSVRKIICDKDSVTKWLDYLFNIWHFRPMKVRQKLLKIAQSIIKLFVKY